MKTEKMTYFKAYIHYVYRGLSSYTFVESMFRTEKEAQIWANEKMAAFQIAYPDLEISTTIKEEYITLYEEKYHDTKF